MSPRRLEQVAVFGVLGAPGGLIDNCAKSLACNFIKIVCDFRVIWICGALAQFTSAILPTIEYTCEDSEKSGGAGAGAGSVFGVAGTDMVEEGFASGSALRSTRTPESEDDFTGVLPSAAGAAGGCAGEARAMMSPALFAAARLFAGSFTAAGVLCASSGCPAWSRSAATCNW